MYTFSDCDALYICGDLNARIGNRQDCSEELDSVPSRVHIDDTVNQHGQSFLEFLNDSKMCVLNGRFDKVSDNITSISTKGRSVVDFICTPQDTFEQCQSFRVLTVPSLIEKYSLHELIGNRCRPPDHSILLCDIRVQKLPESAVPVHESARQANGTTHKRYRLNKMPADFMTSELSKQALLNVINKVECLRENQDNIDAIYSELCDTVIKEMNDCIPYSDCSKKLRKSCRPHKPYWNDELATLWKNVCEKERLFTRFRGKKRERTRLLSEYKYVQHFFEKKLRHFERVHRKQCMDDIETLTTGSPLEFWDKLNTLGPRNKKTVPMETYSEDGSVTSDPDTVYHKWYTDFSNLYKSTETDNSDKDFHEHVLQHKRFMEDNMLDPLYSPNEFLNGLILYSEVEKVALKSKNNKSAGIDMIPYEVLRSPIVIQTLHSLFQRCFDTGIIPSLWRQAIICPIPKDATTDKRIPLNYRGISLLLTIAKLYSDMLNNRIASILTNLNDYHSSMLLRNPHVH